MKFKTIAEAFNHYMNSSIADIEKRAAEIKQLVDTDANADIVSLNIELEGLKQAKANVEQRSAGTPGSGFNPITGMNFERRASYEATEGDIFASTEYRNAFYKTLLGHKLNEFETAAFNRAMTDSATTLLALLPTWRQLSRLPPLTRLSARRALWAVSCLPAVASMYPQRLCSLWERLPLRLHGIPRARPSRAPSQALLISALARLRLSKYFRSAQRLSA